jgi:hypothetical protein
MFGGRLSLYDALFFSRPFASQGRGEEGVNTAAGMVKHSLHHPCLVNRTLCCRANTNSGLANKEAQVSGNGAYNQVKDVVGEVDIHYSEQLSTGSQRRDEAEDAYQQVDDAQSPVIVAGPASEGCDDAQDADEDVNEVMHNVHAEQAEQITLCRVQQKTQDTYEQKNEADDQCKQPIE